VCVWRHQISMKGSSTKHQRDSVACRCDTSRSVVIVRTCTRDFPIVPFVSSIPHSNAVRCRVARQSVRKLTHVGRPERTIFHSFCAVLTRPVLEQQAAGGDILLSTFVGGDLARRRCKWIGAGGVIGRREGSSASL